MRHLTTKSTAVAKNNKALVVVFEKFNGVFIAKVSNDANQKTHAYGETKAKAEENALTNFSRKYHSDFLSL